MYQTRFLIRSTQVDLFGHLNNAVYLELYEWARWEWAKEAGMDLQQMLEKDRIGPAILHIDLSFTKEIRLHEQISVRTWSHSVEKLKGVVAQEMLKENGELASRVFLTFVMFDLDKRKIIPMPEALRTLHLRDEAYRNSRAHEKIKERPPVESGS